MTEVGDREDWARVLLGESAAFGRVFDRHYERLRRQAWRFASNGADVDGVVAMVFLELWRRRAVVPLVNESLAPWLLITTVNIARHHRRTRIRYERLLASLPPPDEIGSPEDRVEDLDVRAALRHLSLNDQQILTLCVLEDYTERAAAEVLDIPPGTVKSRLHRAKRRLTELVPDHTGPSQKENRTRDV